MGAQIAKAAWRAGLADRGLTDRARLALDHMCWLARDTPSEEQPAAEYWGGHVSIGMALLGLEKGGTKSGQNAVRLAVAELLAAGLIEKIEGGTGRHRTRYRILIGNKWAPARPVDNYGAEPLL